MLSWIRKVTSELFTWIVLLDPAGAVLVHLFGFLRQHGVLQVGSVETHGKPAHTSDGKHAVTCWAKQKKSRESEFKHLHLWPSHIELVEDVFLHARGGGGRQSHHRHVGELLTQFVQPLVVWTEIMAPLGRKVKTVGSLKMAVAKNSSILRIMCRGEAGERT